MRSMVEGAAAEKISLMRGMAITARAPSTTLLRSVVPLPRFAGQERRARCDEN
jgi:hypothetical protein